MDTDIESRTRIGPVIQVAFPGFEDMLPLEASLFHRTDNHEDGSKSEWYAIELSEKEYKLLRSCIKNLYKES